MQKFIMRMSDRILTKLFGNQYRFYRWLHQHKVETPIIYDSLTIVSDSKDVLKKYSNYPHYYLNLNHLEGLNNLEGYILFLEEGDKLEFYGGKILNQQMKKNFDLITFDHYEHLGFKKNTFFKPFFNIDLLCSTPYIKNAFVIKLTDISLEKSYTSLQALCYDILLKAFENKKKMGRVQSICLSKKFKDEQLEELLPILKNYYHRSSFMTEINLINNIFYTTYILESVPLVSIIIPTKDHVEDLKRCIMSILEKTTYANYEIIVVDNQSVRTETMKYYEQIKQNRRIKVIYWDEPFNYSRINNEAVKCSKGDVLVFLNNDTEIITPQWLEEITAPLINRDDIGVVGVKLYYFDDTIQHCGVILGIGGVAAHIYSGKNKKENGYMKRIVCQQNYSAVTAACLAIKKEQFLLIGGFNEELAVAFNDIDLCLKIIEYGKRVYYNPLVELYHYESKSRGSDDNPIKKARYHQEYAYMKNRWHSVLDDDPNYNLNLTKRRLDFMILDKDNNN